MIQHLLDRADLTIELGHRVFQQVDAILPVLQLLPGPVFHGAILVQIVYLAGVERPFANGRMPPYDQRMPLPKYHNEPPVPEICIGATEFACIGVLPPHDHPHVYLAIRDESVICPYCSALFRFDPRLDVTHTEPPGHYFADDG